MNIEYPVSFEKCSDSVSKKMLRNYNFKMNGFWRKARHSGWRTETKYKQFENVMVNSYNYYILVFILLIAQCVLSCYYSFTYGFDIVKLKPIFLRDEATILCNVLWIINYDEWGFPIKSEPENSVEPILARKIFNQTKNELYLSNLQNVQLYIFIHNVSYEDDILCSDCHYRSDGDGWFKRSIILIAFS